LGARDGGTKVLAYGTGVVIPWRYAGVGTALQAARTPSKCRGDSRPDFLPGGSLCSPAAIASAAPPSIPANATCLRSPQSLMMRMLGASGDRHTFLLLMRSSKQAKGTPIERGTRKCGSSVVHPQAVTAFIRTAAILPKKGAWNLRPPGEPAPCSKKVKQLAVGL